MTTSRLPAVIDALVSILTPALSNVTVYDGPVPSSLAATRVLAVGSTVDDEDIAGDVAQEWRGIGAKAKQEDGAVLCTAIAQEGTTDVKTLRDACYDIVSTVEDTLRADVTLGGVVTPGWAHVTAGSLRQTQTSDGLVVRVNFTVSYETRI